MVAVPHLIDTWNITLWHENTWQVLISIWPKNVKNIITNTIYPYPIPNTQSQIPNTKCARWSTIRIAAAPVLYAWYQQAVVAVSYRRYAIRFVEHCTMTWKGSTSANSKAILTYSIASILYHGIEVRVAGLQYKDCSCSCTHDIHPQAVVAVPH